MIANHCLLCEVKIDFKFTPECYRGKLQAIHIENYYKNNYHEHVCIQGPLKIPQSMII